MRWTFLCLLRLSIGNDTLCEQLLNTCNGSIFSVYIFRNITVVTYSNRDSNTDITQDQQDVSMNSTKYTISEPSLKKVSFDIWKTTSTNVLNIAIYKTFK